MAIPSSAGRTGHLRRDIQGLRGLSVVLVVLYHAGGLLPGGFVGVDVFFVVSGYVITATLQREWESTGVVRFRRFYARRIRRLLPALALVVSVVAAVSLLLESPNGAQQQTAKTGLGAMATLANFVILRNFGGYFTDGAEGNPLLHTWSLSVEEQFFLVMPVLLVMAWVVGRRTTRGGLDRWVLIVLVVTSLTLSIGGSYGWISVPGFGGTSRMFAFYSSITRAWEFGIGALLVVAGDVVTHRVKRVRPVLGVVGIGLLAVGVGLAGSAVFPGLVVLLPVLGAATLIETGGGSRVVRGLLSHPTLVWLGDISYSWYLWHWPAIVFVRLHLGEGWWLVAAVAVSLLPAYLSYRWVEVPIRYSERFAGRRTVAVLAISIAIPVVFSAGLAAGATRGWGLDWPIGAHEVVRTNCDHGVFEPDRCTWAVADAQGVVLLTGDSQSWGIADGLIDAMEDLGYTTTVATLNGCPFVIGPEPIRDDAKSRDCTTFQQSVLNYALDSRPDAVVISNWSLGYVADDPVSRRRWEVALGGVLGQLDEAGIPIVIAMSPPMGDEEASRRTLIRMGERERWTSEVDQRLLLGWVAALETEIAGSYGSASTFDPFLTFCDGERCMTASGGTEYYTDNNHLSRSGSLLLSQRLYATLQKAVASTGELAGFES